MGQEQIIPDDGEEFDIIKHIEREMENQPNEFLKSLDKHVRPQNFMKSKHMVDQIIRENGGSANVLEEDSDKVSDNFSPSTMQIIQDQ